MYHSKPKEWTHSILELCTSDELEALCLLMGIPYSGIKAVKVARLLDMADLRTEVSTWDEYHDNDYVKAHEKVHEIAIDICGKYKRVELIAMAKRAKTFYSLPKRGIVIGLLQWRTRCRQKGQKFNDELRRATQIQYVLPGFA